MPKLPKSIKPYEPIYIEWDDAAVRAGWQEDGFRFDNDDVLVRHIGFFLDCNDRFLNIISAVAPGPDGHGEVQGIPLGCIQKIKKIKI